MAHLEDPKVAQLQQELIVKEKKIKNAIVIAGQHKAREMSLEELFDNKNDVKEKATNSIEKEEQNKREMALQKDNEQLQQGNAGLRRKEARLVAKVEDLGEILRKRAAEALNEIVGVPKEEPMESEDDNQMSTRDSMEEEELIEDDEVPNDDVISEMGGANEELDNSLDETPIDNDESTQMVQPPNFIDGDMSLDGEVGDVREPAVAEMDSFEMDNVGHFDGIDQSEVARSEHEDSMTDGQIEREEEIDNTSDNQKVSSVDGETELRTNGRSSRRSSKSIKYNESVEDSDGDEAPPVKKSKTVPEKSGKKRTLSIEQPSKSDSLMKKPNVSKLNGTELECPKCEYRTRSVRGWENHLSKIHSTNAKKVGLALRCDCGVDSFTDFHFRTCERANATVIKIEDKKKSQLVNRNDSELKCPECEFHSRTVSGWRHQ